MVDQQLRLNEAALNWDPAEVTVPPVPAVPPGGDPMSVMLSAIAPQVAAAVTKVLTGRASGGAAIDPRS